MRFGHWRAATLAIVLASGLAGGTARAGGILHLGHTIPRETLAQDYRTGDVYYAPPIPYGHYTKDYAGCIHGAAGLLHGGIGKLCGLCLGKGCGACGGQGCHHGDPCGGCGGKGCGACGGLGLFGKHHGDGDCGDGGCGGRGHGGGLLGHHHRDGAVCTIGASPQCGPSPQDIPTPCGKCGGKGLLHGGLLGHRGSACDGCGGLGLLHHRGGNGHGGPCGGCGGRGCGLCGGLGHLGGLGAKAHGLLGLPMGVGHSLLNKVGIGGVEYFVGPGGPVPLTPGYVPYVVPVRSPRDFFAFPPFNDPDRGF